VRLPAAAEGKPTPHIKPALQVVLGLGRLGLSLALALRLVQCPWVGAGSMEGCAGCQKSNQTDL